MRKEKKFKPRHPEKYKGDPTNICYRSSWEFKYMYKLDHSPDIIEWQSEEFFIAYVSPIDGKVHRYFPDFKIKTKDNKILVIEIKPLYQTQPPKQSKGKINKSYIREVATYGVNMAKFEAAKKYCENKGWHFQILTEKELFLY